MDVNNLVLFVTVFGALLMCGGLWALFKPKDMPDVDAAAYNPRGTDYLPNWRFMGAWRGGVPEHSDTPGAGPKGLWGNELEYYEDAEKRRLAKKDAEENQRP